MSHNHFSQVWTHIVCTSKFSLRKSLRWFPTRGLHSIQSLFQLLVLGAIHYWNYNSFQKFAPFFIPSFKYIFFVLPQISAKLGDKKLNETEVKKLEKHILWPQNISLHHKSLPKFSLSKFSYCIFVHFQLLFVSSFFTKLLFECINGQILAIPRIVSKFEPPTICRIVSANTHPLLPQLQLLEHRQSFRTSCLAGTHQIGNNGSR